MASYSGRLDQLMIVKIDQPTKDLLAAQAEKDQSNLSVITRKAIKLYLAQCQAQPTEVQHA